MRTTMNQKPVFTVQTKTIVNFDSRFDKKLLCDGLTFTTGSACAYTCSFCYVEDMQRKSRGWFEKQGVVYPEAGHLGLVIRNADPVEIAHRQIMSKPANFRRTKKVIYASPKVDVAANMELVRETVEMCQMILTCTDWDIRLLSKSNLLPKVAKALSDWGLITQDVAKSRVIYGVSTGTLDDNLAAAFEQGTARVSKRIESLHWLQDNGFRTFGMICPSLPQTSYWQFAREMANAIRAPRCEHVWAEPMNVRGESLERTVAALDAAGYHEESSLLDKVSNNPAEWEHYARETFMAHAELYPTGKLRFLQYATKQNIAWWAEQQKRGAVLL